MKAVLPFALVGALMVGPALAAGYGQNQGASDQSQQKQQQSTAGQRMSEAKMEHDPNVVRQIQGKLKQQGYNVGAVDGRWGQTTEKAIRDFQQDKGLQASGKLDQQTTAALGVSGETQQGQLPEITPPAPSPQPMEQGSPNR